jgi:hypothetical protein
LPTASTTTIAPGAHQVQLQVTNTTDVGRTYMFSSNEGAPADIATVSTYIPAGVTVLVTLNIVPTAAPGTVVSGNLTVANATSSRRGPNQSTMTVLPYTYTVGPPAT